MQQPALGNPVGRRGVFFEDRVRVHTRESECVHTCAARVFRVAVHPRPRVGNQREAIGAALEQFMRLIGVRRGRNDAMVQRQRRLDQTGDPRRGHGVADQ